MATATNVQLGGTGSALLGNTSIATSAFSLTINSSNNSRTLLLNNTGNGTGIEIASVGTGLFVTSSAGNGATIISNDAFGTGISASGSFIGIEGTGTASTAIPILSTNSYTGNGLAIVASYQRAAMSSPADNDGQRIIYQGTGIAYAEQQIVYTNVTPTTRNGRIQWLLLNEALGSSVSNKMTLDGTGYLGLSLYGSGNITGTPTFGLAVDASGKIIEIALGAGSMTNPLTAQGGIIYSADGAGTPAELLIGTTGQYLAVSAGGIPEWVTPGVGGSVTSVGLTSSDITVGGTASPITTSGTFTLTLATVNGNVGSFGSSTSIPTFTVNAKGLITAASGNAVVAPAGTLTGATLAAGVTASSLTSVGALVSGTASTGFVVGGVTMTLGSDAAWDMYVRNASGVLIRIPNGTTGQVLVATTGAIPGWTNAGAGTVTNVTGTANRITSTGGATPQIDISGSYAGQNTITILGTIATGVWNGTAIGTNKGGTGFTSMTNGTIPIGNGGGTWTQATPTGSNGISITMGAGTMNVSNVFNPTVQTLTFGSPIVWNVTNGGNAKVTLTGTGATLSIANPVAGYTYTVEITQGSGGSKTITTWPTGTTWSGPNTLSTTAGDTDLAVLYYNGTNYRAVLTLDYN